MSVYIVAKKEKDFSAIIASIVVERKMVCCPLSSPTLSLWRLFFVFNISGRCLHTCIATFFLFLSFFSFSLSFRFYTFFTLKIFPVRHRLLINILFFNRKSLSSHFAQEDWIDIYVYIFLSLSLFLFLWSDWFDHSYEKEGEKNKRESSDMEKITLACTRFTRQCWGEIGKEMTEYLCDSIRGIIPNNGYFPKLTTVSVIIDWFILLFFLP